MKKPEISLEGKVMTLYESMTDQNKSFLKNEKFYGELWLWGDDFSDLSIFSETYKKIDGLRLIDVEKIDIENFYKLQNIKKLNIEDGTKFPKAHNVEFKKFPKLQWLGFKWQKKYSNWYQCQQLQEIVIYSYMGSFDELPKLKNIKSITLTGGNIANFSGISNFENLETLDIDRMNKLIDISQLEKLKKLKHLSLGKTLVKNIANLSCLSKIEYLYLGNKYDMKDMNFFENFKNLKELITESQYEEHDFTIFFKLKSIEKVIFNSMKNLELTKSDFLDLAKKYEKSIDVGIYGKKVKTLELVFNKN